LHTIRNGPGASILHKDVRKIHLDFAVKINDGHFGARKVWRDYLPRLKFYNPSVSMTVNRSQDQNGPAILTVFYTSPAAASRPVPQPSSKSRAPGSLPAAFDRTEVIEMKHRHERDILSDLLELTRALPVVPSADAEVELRQINEDKKRSEEDRVRNAAYMEQKRHEKALLEQARGLTDTT
ncbi:MAG: hypothetical protein Q9214_005735, partial [Letrouitia sp. 1 TL-2023]